MKKRSRVYIIGFLILLVGVVVFNDFSEGEGRGNLWSTKAIKALGSLINSDGEIDLSGAVGNLTPTDLPAVFGPVAGCGGRYFQYNAANNVLDCTPAYTFNGAQFNGAVNVGVDDTGYDVKFFGATSGKYELWDESADKKYIVGAFEVGDLTNFTRISNAGAISYGGSAKPTECKYLDTVDAYLPATAPAALVTVAGNGAYQVLDYDSDTDETAWWRFRVPAGYDAGNATVEFYWHSAAATTGDVIMVADIVAVSDSDAENGTVVSTTLDTSTADPADGDRQTGTGTLTTPFVAGDQVKIGFRRDADAAGDTLVGDMRLTGCYICWSRES